MIGRISLLGFVAACGVVHRFPSLPSASTRMGFVAVALLISLIVFWWKPSRGRRLLIPLWAIVAGLSLTMLRVDQRLGDVLTAGNENKVSRVVLRVAGLPRLAPDSRQFEAEVISSIPEGVPSRIRVTWAASAWAGPYGGAAREPAQFPDIVPGQIWRMALTLKRPQGTRNPDAFDYEAYLFAHGIRATGSVRGEPLLLGDEAWASLPVVAQRARHVVREAMQAHLQGKRYGPVLLALAIGDQASVEAADWQIFNRSGITHLVSISGSHITMIAALGGAMTFWLWRRLQLRGRALAERLPAQLAAAMAALLVAWLYCLLAGWGVPARRTFLMLAVVAGAYLLRMPLSPTRVLAVAAFAVVVLDPWALLASGFWLSFGAVYVLMASGGWWGRRMPGQALSRLGRAQDFCIVATRLQMAITVALMPLLALIFHEVSIVSPVVNAYAIPVISLIVTPLALLLAGFAIVPGLDGAAWLFAWLGHTALELMMAPTVWLAGLRGASLNVAAAPWPLTLLGMLGVVVAAMPYGLPGRHAGWLLLAPALFWAPKRPADGGWDLHALDVGQAGAVVIQTSGHAFLFDTGLRSSATSDDGARVIWPFLRSRGITRLDVMVVSHADIDHAGGARSLLEALPVEQSYSSFDLQAYLTREARLLGEAGRLPPLPLAMTGCGYGMTWEVDGVAFEFLWPLDEGWGSRAATSRQRNDGACVLHVRGKHHSVLLPADVSAPQEVALVSRGLGPVDLVLAAHHGSKSSSGAQFVNAVQATHVVAQAGAWNRYGHPSAVIEQRWKHSGARFWRTDWHGAVRAHSSENGLVVRGERQSSQRYWQTR